jgi:DNA mismatch repair protein MutS
VAAREYKDDIIFLRKIVAGRSDRSYGIQVARLAGLPPAVVSRAKEILAGLEHDELTRGGRPTISETPHDARSEQLGLFTTPAGRDDEISRMLRSLNVDDTTPLQALALLAELKRMIGE